MSGIQMGLMGAVGDIIDIADHTAVALAFEPATAVAAYILSNNGKTYENVGSGNIELGDWVLPNSRANQYECRATLVSGAIASGVLNTWLSLATLREWSAQQNVVGSQTTVLTIEIRFAGGSALDSATITLIAQVDV